MSRVSINMRTKGKGEGSDEENESKVGQLHIAFDAFNAQCKSRSSCPGRRETNRRFLFDE